MDTRAKPSATKRSHKPRRVIHCSDGVIEEYSTDEEEERAKEEAERKRNAWRHVDPATLGWMAWAMRYFWLGGESVVSTCDFIGEKVAWWLGITSPKYFYELEAAKRMEERERARRLKEDAEMRGWRPSPEGGEDGVVAAKPTAAGNEQHGMQPQPLSVPKEE